MAVYFSTNSSRSPAAAPAAGESLAQTLNMLAGLGSLLAGREGGGAKKEDSGYIQGQPKGIDRGSNQALFKLLKGLSL